MRFREPIFAMSARPSSDEWLRSADGRIAVPMLDMLTNAGEPHELTKSR